MSQANTRQATIFDPALRNNAEALIPGDPLLPSAELDRWLDARRHATDHVLKCIAGVPQSQRLSEKAKHP